MPDRKTDWNAAELLAAHLPEAKWAVPGIVAEGLTLLAGPPKVGKSWLAANLAVDVASENGMALGGIEVIQGDVLLMSLEDTARRLQGRLRKMLGDTPPPRRLSISTEWPALDNGATARLEGWLSNHPAARLVVIDVLAKIRGRGGNSNNQYAEDYAVMSQLKEVADRHSVAFLVVTHVRKMGATDFLEQVSGTNGIAGAADCTIVLTRGRTEKDGELNITGRDVEEMKYSMKWRPEDGRWDLDGASLADATAAAQRAELATGLSERSIKILAFIDQHPEGVRAADVATHLNVKQDIVRVCLRRLEVSGRIRNPQLGLYVPVTTVTGVTALPLIRADDRASVAEGVTATVTPERAGQRPDVTAVTPVTGGSKGCPVCFQQTMMALVPTTAGPACRKCAPGIQRDTRCADCKHPRDLTRDGRCNPCHGSSLRIGAA